jgi:hypothetical protein
MAGWQLRLARHGRLAGYGLLIGDQDGQQTRRRPDVDLLGQGREVVLGVQLVHAPQRGLLDGRIDSLGPDDKGVLREPPVVSRVRHNQRLVTLDG